MSKRLSSRDRILLIFLVVLLIGVCYYLFFFKPLQAELANVDTQIQELETEIEVSMAKIGSMNSMQEAATFSSENEVLSAYKIFVEKGKQPFSTV